MDINLGCPQGIARKGNYGSFLLEQKDLIVAMVSKLHLFLGLTIFLVFPFTRLVHMLSLPLRYVTRPGYQIVRSRRKASE